MSNAVIKYIPANNEFLKIIPDTIIEWDTIWIDAAPVIVRIKEDWQKGIWIAGTLLINLVVFVGRELKKRKTLK